MTQRSETSDFTLAIGLGLIGLCAVVLGTFWPCSFVAVLGAILICLAFHVLLSPH